MTLLKSSELHGIEILERKIFHSDLGLFSTTPKPLINEYNFVQDSCSRSIYPGTIRGLHFQREPYSQAKLISVFQGGILDFFVDLRVDSKTYLSHGSLKLTQDDPLSLLIPRGFAHGFLTLVPNTIVSYRLDNIYDPEMEETLLWNDPTIGIEWPQIDKKYMAPKDQQGKSLEKILEI